MKLLPKILIWTASIATVGYVGLTIARAIPSVEPFVDMIPVVNRIPTFTGTSDLYCGVDEFGNEYCMKAGPKLHCITTAGTGLKKEECFESAEELNIRQAELDEQKLQADITRLTPICEGYEYGGRVVIKSDTNEYGFVSKYAECEYNDPPEPEYSAPCYIPSGDPNDGRPTNEQGEPLPVCR